MEAYEAILTRRSVRAYTDQPVSDEMIQKLLVAAMSAPSAGNGQPWHFVVITERAVLDALADLLPFGKMLKQAPLAIAVCGETRGQPFDGYWVQDCSAATENLLLAAHALGLGGVWLGVYPREERVASVRNILGMPTEVTPLCVISIGHSAEPGGSVDRYRAERVHRDRW
ncbi:MAG: nitroreductase family protein [Anaerolineae bacterium]|nr:nitroreductase family protein [Anaerolineae bacterium]